MPSIAELEAIIRKTDKPLDRSETVTTNAIDRELRAALRNLEAEIRRLDAVGLSQIDDLAKREQRARALVSQLEPVLAAFDLGAKSSGVPDQFGRSYVVADKAGADLAAQILGKFDPALDAKAKPDLAAIHATLANSRERLTAHGEQFAADVEAKLVAGLVRGESAAKLIAEARAAVGSLKSKAEQILTTDTAATKDRATRDAYDENGVELVLVSAILDELLCGWCFDRHMQVFRRDECPIPQHPRCRCTRIALNFKWVDQAMLDEIEASKAEAAKRAQEPKKHTQTPAEKFAGMPMSKPVPLPKRTVGQAVKDTARAVAGAVSRFFSGN